jgi:predicted porin
MKKLVLASAIAALSVSAAQAAPTVYGKAFVTMDYVNTDDGAKDSDSLQVNSNLSRIGFKGSEAMTANTDVIYQLEYNVAIDGNRAEAFVSRDTYLGLKNDKYGEFRFGHQHSTAQWVNNVLVGKGYYDNQASFMADSKRIKNSVLWRAPKVEGIPVQVTAMYGAEESGNNDGYGIAAMYNAGTGFTAGLSYDKDLDISAGGEIMRGTATVDLGKYMAAPIKLGALYQVADFDGRSEDEKGLMVSGEMGLTNFAKPASVYAQYLTTADKGGVANADADQILVGGTYKYQPNMIAHAYAGTSSIDSSNTDTVVVGGGLEYLF